MILIGCSTTKSMVDKLTPETPWPAKRVMVQPLIDLAGAGDTKTVETNTQFLELLREHSRLTIYELPEGTPKLSRIKPSDVCFVTPPETLKKAESLGMHVLVGSVLNPIETRSAKTGVWPLRTASKVYEVSMVVNVVDVSNGTLYLNNLETEDVAIPIDELESRDEKEVVAEVLEKALPQILKRQVSAVSSELSEEPWSGKILSVDEQNVLINAGADVGIEPGQLFGVYEEGESIRCQNGKTFQLLGKKVGEIKASSVMENRSAAVTQSGGPFVPGQVIRFRR
jgi:hypothetical protein